MGVCAMGGSLKQSPVRNDVLTIKIYAGGNLYLFTTGKMGVTRRDGLPTVLL